MMLECGRRISLLQVHFKKIGIKDIVLGDKVIVEAVV